MPFLSALDTAEIADAVASTMDDVVVEVVPGERVVIGPGETAPGEPTYSPPLRARVRLTPRAERLRAGVVVADDEWTIRVDATDRTRAWTSRTRLLWTTAPGGPRTLAAVATARETPSGRFIDLDAVEVR